jgi:hypothetical protein
MQQRIELIFVAQGAKASTTLRKLEFEERMLVLMKLNECQFSYWTQNRYA